MTVLGAVFLPSNPPERLRGTAEAADAAGLEELWVWEDCFFESGVAALTAALGWTSRLRVGVGLLPVPLRNVALTAMEAATLARLFPGRVRLGVGHGVLDWMGQVGARRASPLTLLGEYLDALRALLAGEEVTVEGRYVQLDRVRLDWPAALPVLAGAEGPKTLDLVGARADGLIATGGTELEVFRAAVARALAARSAAGGVAPFEVVTYLPADPEAGAPAAARNVAAFAEAGAGTVVLQPPRGADPEAYVRWVAAEVRPLVPASALRRGGGGA